MKIGTIEDLIKRAPFKPLELILDNGMKFKVKHPDFIFITPDKHTIIIADGEHIQIIETNKVSNIATSGK